MHADHEQDCPLEGAGGAEWPQGQGAGAPGGSTVGAVLSMNTIAE